MKIINPSFEFIDEVNSEAILNKIEKAYRICYMSETKGNRDNFIKSKIAVGHESPLEHASVSVMITTNRGVTHELVRHRIASHSQSSTRYCNYSKDKFGNQLTFIRPAWVSEDTVGEWVNIESRTDKPTWDLATEIWFNSCLNCEYDYLDLLKENWTPQQARDVLNNSLATSIIMTMNIREWRHCFKLRALGTTGKPHPEMLQITIPMLKAFKKAIPVVFDDLIVKE